MAGERPGLAAERASRALGFRLIAGIDEAGRGCLAGPVVAAAVILPLDSSSLLQRLSGIRDSKLLAATRREHLATEVESVAVAVGVGVSPSWEVDDAGIVGATRRAMARAVAALDHSPDSLLIDALRLPEVACPQRAIVKGDRSCLSIAAASVVAKVVRDEWMSMLDRTWPGYGFRMHKGYATAAHRRALAALGPCPFTGGRLRRSRPCSRVAVASSRRASQRPGGRICRRASAASKHLVGNRPTVTQPL